MIMQTKLVVLLLFIVSLTGCAKQDLTSKLEEAGWVNSDSVWTIDNTSDKFMKICRYDQVNKELALDLAANEFSFMIECLSGQFTYPDAYYDEGTNVESYQINWIDQTVTRIKNMSGFFSMPNKETVYTDTSVYEEEIIPFDEDYQAPRFSCVYHYDNDTFGLLESGEVMRCEDGDSLKEVYDFFKSYLLDGLKISIDELKE